MELGEYFSFYFVIEQVPKLVADASNGAFWTGGGVGYQFFFEGGCGVVAVALVFGEMALAGGELFGSDVDEAQDAGLSQGDQFVEQGVGFGLSEDAEAGGVADIVQHLGSVFRLDGQFTDVGGPVCGRMEDVSIQVEEGGEFEGRCDFV